MDFWGTVFVLFRRWYVTLPVFFLVMAGAVGVYVKFPKTYVASSALALVMPPAGGSLPTDPKYPNPLTNPLVNFDSGLSVTASILIQGMSTAEIAAQVGAPPGGRTTFKVTNGASNPELMISVPFIVISSEAPTAAQAHDVVVKLTALAHEKLAQQQRAVGTPVGTYITAFEIVPPTTPEEKTGSRLRATFVAVTMGFLLSLASAFAAESLDARRRARKRAAGGAAAYNGSGSTEEARAATAGLKS